MKFNIIPKSAGNEHKKKVILFWAVAVLLVIAVVLFALLFRSESEPSEPKQGETEPGILKEDSNVEDYVGKHKPTHQENSIAIPGFRVLRLKANSLEQEPGFYNPDINKSYFVIEVRLDDGTLLYKSDLIAPGKAIYKAQFSEILPEGSYSAIVIYHCYALDSLEERNGAKIKIKVEVT